MKTYLLEEMTWPEIKEAMAAGVDTVIICAASTEQHGPALPEMTDTVLGYACAAELAKKLGNALVAPVIRPGLSGHHMGFAGTVTLRPEIFQGIVEDYIAAYVHHGFHKIVLISSHGGNFGALEDICAEQAEKYPDICIVTGCSLREMDEALAEMEQKEGLKTGACGGHACDFETSAMLSINEAYVRRDKLQAGHVGQITDTLLQKFFEEGVASVSEIGVMGDPTGAEAARGTRYLSGLTDVHVKAVKQHMAEWEEKH